MVVAKICDVTITVPTSITEIKLIHFNDFVYQLLYIVPSIRNSNFNIKFTFDGNRLGDGHFVGCDSCFVHRENKIQEESLAVNSFFKFFLTVVDFFGVNLFRDGIQISPKTTNFDRSFHTSSKSLPEF